MPRTAAAKPATPQQPFRRPMPVSGLKTSGDTAFRIAAEPEERAALARFLGVDSVERLSCAGFVGPHGKGGWRVRGRLVAKIVQTCVVTLEPVRTRIEEDVERTYVPSAQAPRQHEVILLPDDEDEPDPFTDTIDPAALAVDSLSLLIDPYPRCEGVAMETPAADRESDDSAEAETAKPFSALSVLMRRTDAEES